MNSLLYNGNISLAAAPLDLWILDTVQDVEEVEDDRPDSKRPR